MGKINRGILGGFSGKVANVVGSAWKGIAYMKSLPLSVANPRTAAQVAQRSKFANISRFASDLLVTIIKPLWDRFAQKQSGYNAFVQTNIDLFATAFPNPFADLVISHGQMAPTTILSIALVAGGDLNVTWDDDSGQGFKLDSDKAYALWLNETQENFTVNDGEHTREILATSAAPATPTVVGDVIHAYLAFRREDGTIVSDNSYKTGVIVA